jgi:hypothetical protein
MNRVHSIQTANGHSLSSRERAGLSSVALLTKEGVRGNGAFETLHGKKADVSVGAPK